MTFEMISLILLAHEWIPRLVARKLPVRKWNRITWATRGKKRSRGSDAEAHAEALLQDIALARELAERKLFKYFSTALA